ncbi:MAG: DUF3365 domain-containing protein [Planctomycetes bacterium]|nr:DUF3365 domain-containing protein [Planctomycetota bacterium]
MREARVRKMALGWLGGLLWVGACTGGDTGWREVATAELAPSEQRQRERALAARDALKSRLLAELGAAMERSGAAGAIEVCRQRAPILAEEVAKQHGVRIGRTSEKLRQPQNASPEWALAAVRAKRGSEVDFRGPDGALGLLDPLRIAPLCLFCHGAEEQIDPLVRAKLRERYPEDRATGYALEQLRGHVWVEVPPER